MDNNVEQRTTGGGPSPKCKTLWCLRMSGMEGDRISWKLGRVFTCPHCGNIWMATVVNDGEGWYLANRGEGFVHTLGNGKEEE